MHFASTWVVVANLIVQHARATGQAHCPESLECSLMLQENLNGLQARYDELKRGRIEEVEAVLEANRRAASNKIASLEAACEGWKAEAHRQQQRVESLNPEGFRAQMLQ